VSAMDHFPASRNKKFEVEGEGCGSEASKGRRRVGFGGFCVISKVHTGWEFDGTIKQNALHAVGLWTFSYPSINEGWNCPSVSSIATL
jgi:hypothetical protein